MEVIEVRMREQHEIDGRQIFYLDAGVLEAFEEKKPVRKIRIHQRIEIVKLHEEGSVPDPGQCDFAFLQCGKLRLAVHAGALGDQGLPDHLMEKGARVEMVARRQLLQRTGDTPLGAVVFVGTGLAISVTHTTDMTQGRPKPLE
jgi:hypothetical protein